MFGDWTRRSRVFSPPQGLEHRSITTNFRRVLYRAFWPAAGFSAGAAIMRGTHERRTKARRVGYGGILALRMLGLAKRLLAAKIIAGYSLFLWVGAMYLGRISPFLGDAF